MPDDTKELAVTAPSANLLGTVETAIVLLPDDAPNDAFLQIHEELSFYKREAARLLDMVEDRMIARIKESGPIKFGNGITYYLTHPKVTKCNDVPAAVEALLDACGGDFGKLCEVLSASAIKHGAAKKVLPPEAFARLFTVTKKDKLESGDEAPPELTRGDAKFL